MNESELFRYVYSKIYIVSMERRQETAFWNGSFSAIPAMDEYAREMLETLEGRLTLEDIVYFRALTESDMRRRHSWLEEVRHRVA